MILLAVSRVLMTVMTPMFGEGPVSAKLSEAECD